MTLDAKPVKVFNTTSVVGTGGSQNYDSYSEDTIEVEYTERYSNPDWKVKVANGLDASTYYNRQIIKVTQGSCSVATSGYRWPYEQLRSSYSGRWCTIAGFWGPHRFDNDVRDIALNRLKKKLRAETGEFNAAVPTAELREMRGLIHQIAHVSSNVFKTLVHLKRNASSPAAYRAAAKQAADIWLGYNFGLAPLLRDAVSVAEALAAWETRRERTVVKRGEHTANFFNVLGNQGRVGAPTGAYTSFEVQCLEEIAYKFTAGSRLAVDHANNYGLFGHLGFMPESLPSILWELTAFSWVVDYFSTVGNYLDDTFTSPSGTTQYCVENRRYKNYVTQIPKWNLSVEYAAAVDLKVGRATPNTIEVLEFNRTPLTQIPRAALRFRSLDEVGLNSVTKLLNLASLLIK